MVRTALTRWLYAPNVTGWVALIFGLVAVWVPSVIRLAVNGVVTGCEFTPYLPFVLICAIMLPWWAGALVAFASVAVLGGLFGGSPAFQMSCFEPAAAIFLASSALMIGVAILVREAIGGLQRRGDDSSNGIIFSVEKGDVWASWHGLGAPVRLGSQRKVALMMEDFLANEESGHRESE